jgi:hypothetical protein
MPTAFADCIENITCYALIGIFQMLAGEGCEHLLELKKLALSCHALVLQDIPAEASRIAKTLMKNCRTKHGSNTLGVCCSRNLVQMHFKFKLNFFVSYLSPICHL